MSRWTKCKCGGFYPPMTDCCPNCGKNAVSQETTEERDLAHIFSLIDALQRHVFKLDEKITEMGRMEWTGDDITYDL